MDDPVANEGTPRFSRSRIAAAWGVHLFTALGLPLALFAVGALYAGNAAGAFVALWLATFIDSVDGTMARRVGVSKVTPEFDGRRLDDIVDFINFAFLPAVALVALGVLPPGWEFWAAVPVMASGYGFCQDNAKTDDAFVGFPSYWNAVAIYLYVLDAQPHTAVAFLVVFSLMVFVPIHYIYPTKTRFMRKFTLPIGAGWAVVLLALCLYPDASWANQVAAVSLVVPVYYLVVSLIHHWRVHHPTGAARA